MAEELSFPPIHVPRVENEPPQIAAQIARAKLDYRRYADKEFKNRFEKSGVFIFNLPYHIDEQDAYSAWAEPSRIADL